MACAAVSKTVANPLAQFEKATRENKLVDRVIRRREYKKEARKAGLRKGHRLSRSWTGADVWEKNAGVSKKFQGGPAASTPAAMASAMDTQARYMRRSCSRTNCSSCFCS